MLSQPSHLSSSVPVHSDLSPAQSRRMRPSLRQTSISASKAVFSSGEPEPDCEAGAIAFEQRAAPPRDGAEQLVERVGELLHALVDQLFRDLLQRDAVLLQLGEYRAGARNVLLDGVGRRLAVVAECVHGRRRHRIHGVAADQRLDIHRVLVGRIFGAGGSPEQALRLRARRGQTLPARAGEQLLVANVGELRVGDRHLAAEPIRQPLVVELVQPLVDGRVDAADEKAGDAADLGDVAARPRQVLEPGDIGFDDLLVDAHGEQQGDVDVQSATDQLADRRNAGRGRRHLHHQVRTLHRRPEPQRLGDRRFGVVGQVGRAFQADIAIPALRLVVDRAQHIGGAVDIGDRQMLVDCGDAVVGLGLELFQRIRVFVALADGLLEDRRVRGHALQSVAFDQRAQLALLDQAALEIVQPGRLAACFELLQRIHAVCLLDFLDFAICSLRGGEHLLRREAEFRHQILDRGRGAKGVHADLGAARADIAIPADHRALLDRHARRDVGRQHAVAIGLVLLLEQLPGRHADDARRECLRA